MVLPLYIHVCLKKLLFIVNVNSVANFNNKRLKMSFEQIGFNFFPSGKKDAETCSETIGTFKMELFAEIVTDF